jgi:molecular chaperone IbpA
MRYDWTPLWRSTIGFDRLFDILDEVQRTSEESYPPTISNGSTKIVSRSR